jgi:hypothetical protein
MQTARENSERAIAGIRQGRIVPEPADEDKCQYCSVANACRYEVAAIHKLTTIAAGATSE